MTRNAAVEEFSRNEKLGRFTLRDEEKTIAIGQIIELPPKEKVVKRRLKKRAGAAAGAALGAGEPVSPKAGGGKTEVSPKANGNANGAGNGHLVEGSHKAEQAVGTASTAAGDDAGLKLPVDAAPIGIAEENLGA